MMRHRFVVLLSALTLGCWTINPLHAEPVFATEAKPVSWRYLDGAEAEQMVSEAQEEAAAVGRNVAIIFGTESCHDTRALLQWLGQPDVAKWLNPAFDFILVESGRAKDRNLALAREFGVERIEGTPSLIILSGRDGVVVNRKAIATLRTAARQSPDQLMAYFRKYQP